MSAAAQGTGDFADTDPSLEELTLEDLLLEEVVVTARRREERLQDTPISMTGLDFTDSLGFTTGYWAPERRFGLEATARF